MVSKEYAMLTHSMLNDEITLQARGPRSHYQLPLLEKHTHQKRIMICDCSVGTG